MDSDLRTLNKCRWLEGKLENRIEALPDDVLISIVSHLNLKEAARTSVISRSWRYLWTHTTGGLDFVESIPKHTEQNILDLSRFKLIDWVNQVLNVHKASTLDVFKVSFGISDESSNVINKWIKFALQRRVKRLLLDFRCIESSPYAKFSVTTHVFTNCPLGSLTCLHLKNVDMTETVLEFILLNFPLLQVLHLNSVSSLARLKIAGPSPFLRCLKIKHCFSLHSLEVHAVNIVSFAYHGPTVKKFFKKVPRLVEASINEDFLIKNIHKFSSYFSRLESLKLDLQDWHWMVGCFPELPKFKKLKYLKLSWSRNIIECFMALCTRLLNASPLLQRFVLKTYSILKNEDKDILTPVFGLRDASR
ncbi:putative F-box/FBD/LRR-repeat protein At1g22000 isoform X2 [Silene latifolia]|uniref:putative F-box/FBD/LRR-repeat protein At1g22000 isoform X2 n=1 Tax=Silene latifolia TaxID=37657 RepID=UPI003D78112D